MEHLTQKQIQDYGQSQLQVTELLSVTDHLAECETCRQQIQGGINDNAEFFSMRALVFDDDADILPTPQMYGTHLPVEQMAEYADRQVSGEALQIVEDHLSSCEKCAIAVDDLRTFRNEIAPSLDREYRPASVPAPTEGWWHRTATSFRGVFRTSPIPAFGTAFGLILLLMIGWLILRRQSEKGPKPEIVVVPASSPQPPLIGQPVPSPAQPEPVNVVAQLKDGEGVVTLDQQGKLSGVDDLPPTYQSMVKKVLLNGRVEKSSQLNGLTRPGSSLMSEDKETGHFSVIEPGGVVLMSDRPTFRWSKLEGATGYIVEVYNDKFQLVSESPQLTTQSWTPPQPLSRGLVYGWQVKAIKEGQEITSPRPPAPQAKFRVLDLARANEIANAKRAHSSSHLTLALLYAEAGLLKESEQELRLLLKANPDSAFARSLLRQVQTLER